MLNEQNAKMVFFIFGLAFFLIFISCHETETAKTRAETTGLLRRIKHAESQQEYDKALKLIGNAEKEDNEITAEIYFIKGNIHAALNSFEKASKAYTEALRIDSNHSQSRNNLSLLLADQGYIHDAIKLLSSHTDDPISLSNTALFQSKLGNYNDAGKMLNKAIVLNPKDPTHYQQLGSLLLKQGRHNDAEKVIVKSWNLDSTLVESARLMGLLYQEKDDSKRAIFFFRRALLIDPNHLDSNYNLSMALAKIDQISESKIYMAKFEELSARSAHIAQIRRLLDEQPHSSRLRVELATHYLHLNKIPEAEAQYHIILDRDSLHIEALVKLTQISIQNKRLEKAKRFSARGIQYLPEKKEIAPLYASLGYINLINKNYTVAEDILLKAISLDSTLSDAWNNLGNLYQEKNKTNIAQKTFEKALSIDSKNSLAAYNLGVIYYNLDSINNAKNYFFMALQADSTYWRAQLALGEIYENSDSLNNAIFYYNDLTNNQQIAISIKNHAQERIASIRDKLLR